jgi:hypothetical protein
MSNIIIDDLLNDKDRVCVPDHLIQLIKDNLEVVPITTYKLRSNCSEYEYTKAELDWTKDHINQLINDILLANLDKVKHLDNRIYKFFEADKNLYKPTKFIWLVRDKKLFKVVVTEVYQILERDYTHEYVLTEYVSYHEDGIYTGQIFNNNKDFLKFGGQYLDKFFETEDEALNYIKEEQNNGQID